ncbi:MAG: biotin--[acetyl-CoA-carboxylase] ligase [Burkholderiales bacterium]|nr:biotin--[acetyl-CoA-carboxylase] ligase [Burkholderiales bacterium]
MKAATFAVLRQLAAGTPCASAVLAQAVGLPRAAVGAAVRELRAHGVEVRAVRGRGYALGAPADLLDRAAVAARLAQRGAPIVLDLADECVSTNAALLERAASGAGAGTALACELQTAGRGRRGARWHARLLAGLTFSVLWRYERARSDFGALPLAVGVACARALDALGVRGVRLKWPNDLVHGGGKLGGILVEAASEAGGPTAVVVGVGVNVRGARALGATVGQPVSDLAALARDVPPRTALLAELLAEIASALEAFGRHGFAAFREEWSRRHAQQDAPVRLLLPGGGAVDGVALGVAEDGALLVATRAGVERHHAGAVSLRAAT